MGEKRYIISDASKMLKVESHVLRYWEEELDIKIPRNEMGHRYYTENHINLLKNIRDLKEQGYGLRTIKLMIAEPQDVKKLPETVATNSKMEQFQKIMGSIVARALEETTGDIVAKAVEESTGKAVTKAMNESTEGMTKEVSDKVSEKVLKGMDYIMRMQDEKEEARYKQLDEVIRSRQRKRKNDKKLIEKINKKETKLQNKQKRNIRSVFSRKTQTT